MTAGVYVSALDMFSIGIGPSSSHTVGPMIAGARFRNELENRSVLSQVDRYEIQLHGSLAATGIGHGTPDAVLAGLAGLQPHDCDPAMVHGQYAALAAGEQVVIDSVRVRKNDIQFQARVRDRGHPNALTLVAFDSEQVLLQQTYLSIGGGFVVQAQTDTHGASGQPMVPTASLPQPVSSYRNMDELLGSLTGESIAQVARRDENFWHSADGLEQGLDRIWHEMSSCVQAGLAAEGTLPGGLGVKRRAAAVYSSTLADAHGNSEALVNSYAMAVNEQNAGGGRVVTAPTNGAAGIIPAVLYYLVQEGLTRPQIHEFLLTASVIGSIIKANASISGAEAGCQAEIGSACAMAAAGLTAVRGGSAHQVENAAEIALEHHLGLTCDPVGGLVQIPCIERNAIAASTALTASRIALHGDGTHIVSLDTAVKTMREVGRDMLSKYKETSTGGLAVTVPYC